MGLVVTFADSEELTCSQFVRAELMRRGVPEEAVDLLANLVRDASAMPAPDDSSVDRRAHGLVRIRRCWAIREEDLDWLGALAKFAAPVAGGVAAINLGAGTPALTTMTAGIAG